MENEITETERKELIAFYKNIVNEAKKYTKKSQKA